MRTNDVERLFRTVRDIAPLLTRGMCPDDSDEILQRALVAGWRALSEGRDEILCDPDRLFRFLWTTVRRERAAILSSRWRAASLILEAQTSSAGAPHALEEAEALVARLLGHLPHGSAGREVLEAFLDGLPSRLTRFAEGFCQVRALLRRLYVEEEVELVFDDFLTATKILRESR